MAGGTVCRMHGGAARQVRAAAERRVVMAEVTERAAHLGGSLNTDPHEALLAAVREAAANVEFLRVKVQELPPRRRRLVDAEAGDDGAELLVSREEDPDARWVVEEPGVYGPNHTGDAAPHIWWDMYNRERDRLVRYSKICIDAKIDERRVLVEERYGTEIGRVVVNTLVRLELGDDVLARARIVLAEEMRELTP